MAADAPHPVAEELDRIGAGWLMAFADQGFEDIAAVVSLTQADAV
jgi:hypothetical protein